MICQAWNLYSYATPIIKQFFGICPQASDKTIQLIPQMPNAWDNAALENVLIGDNALSMYYQKKQEGIGLKIQQRKNWQIKVQYPKGKYTHWKLNGSVVKPQSSDLYDFIWVKGKSNQVEAK